MVKNIGIFVPFLIVVTKCWRRSNLREKRENWFTV
jgi:glycopeptide antibiotics resistance protein